MAANTPGQVRRAGVRNEYARWVLCPPPPALNDDFRLLPQNELCDVLSAISPGNFIGGQPHKVQRVPRGKIRQGSLIVGGDGRGGPLDEATRKAIGNQIAAGLDASSQSLQSTSQMEIGLWALYAEILLSGS